MSQLAVQIEDRLHSAGYKTERVGGEVQVFDPVHRLVAGSSMPIIDHYNLVEIRSLSQAWTFIQERA